MRSIGFSTGALTRGDFNKALTMLRPLNLPCVELSALRLSEVSPLLNAIPYLELSSYSYVSFHAPSKFSAQEEEGLAELLYEQVPAHWPIVLHPDVVVDWSCWAVFGARIAIENMDRRKDAGRNLKELNSVFGHLPAASLCLDLGHARQCDSSMTGAYLILHSFGHRLIQVHLSEVNSASQHDKLSYGAKAAFRQVANLVPDTVPIILESRVTEAEIVTELEHASESLTPLRSAKSTQSQLLPSLAC